MNEYVLSVLLFVLVASSGAALRAFGPRSTNPNLVQFCKSLGLILYVASIALLVVGPVMFGEQAK